MSLTSSLNLASQTPLERDELRKLKTIISLLIQHPDAAQFLEPVNWQSLQLLDYPRIVKKPMDLGTISDKMAKQQYIWMEQVLDDIQMVWDNCKSYNQAGSWIYSVADKMEKFFRKLVKNYFNSIVIPIQNNKPVAKEQAVQPARGTRVASKRVEKTDSKIYFQNEGNSLKVDKVKVVQKLKKLNQEQLGVAIQTIMKLCPQAYELVGDRISIYVENLQSWLLKEINEKLAQYRESDQRPSKHVKS